MQISIIIIFALIIGILFVLATKRSKKFAKASNAYDVVQIILGMFFWK